MRKYLVGIAGALAISSMATAATLNSISKDQIRQAFVNNTFTSVAVNHLNEASIDNTFTGYMNNAGKIWGMFSRKPKAAPQVDAGTYTIKDDGSLCLTWKHWWNGKEFCVYAYDTENAYIMVGTNNKFHTVFLKSAIKSGKHIKI